MKQLYLEPFDEYVLWLTENSTPPKTYLSIGGNVDGEIYILLCRVERE